MKLVYIISILNIFILLNSGISTNATTSQVVLTNHNNLIVCTTDNETITVINESLNIIKKYPELYSNTTTEIKIIKSTDIPNVFWTRGDEPGVVYANFSDIKRLGAWKTATGLIHEARHLYDYKHNPGISTEELEYNAFRAESVFTYYEYDCPPEKWVSIRMGEKHWEKIKQPAYL